MLIESVIDMMGLPKRGKHSEAKDRKRLTLCSQPSSATSQALTC